MTYERMLSIISHQRDTNLNHNEIALHTRQNGHHKKMNKQKVQARLWRKRNPSTLLVGMQTGAAIVENSMEFPEKTKDELFFDPAIPVLGLYPKNPEYQFERTCAPQYS